VSGQSISDSISVSPEGRLALFEQKHQIDRTALLSKLQAAMAEQQELDQYMAAHAREAADWKTLKNKFTYRRARALASLDHLGNEIKESRFDDRDKTEWAGRLSRLREELDSSLAIRASAARFLTSIARRSSLRTRGRPGAGLVNVCLQQLLDELRTINGHHINKLDRLAYVGALAQVCGMMRRQARDPGAAVAKRLKGKAVAATREQLEAARRLALSMRIPQDPNQESIGETVTWVSALARGEWAAVPAVRFPDSKSPMPDARQKSRKENESEEN
jgi:hypothetical protein